MTLNIVPLAGLFWDQYLLLYRIHQTADSGPSADGGQWGLGVSDEHTNLVAGVSFYPTTDRWVLVEHFVTNPECSRRERFEAAMHLAQASLVFGAAIRKFPLAMVRHRSIARILEAVGYTRQPTGVWIAVPGVQLPPRRKPCAIPGNAGAPGETTGGGTIT